MNSDTLRAERSAHEERLKTLEQQLEHELLARGFDPAQVENIPLSGSLAQLKMEVDRLRMALEPESYDDE